MNATPRRQVHLGVHLPSVPAAFDAIVRLAHTAERGLFDFVLVGDGFDAFTTLAALAAVTDRVGLAGSIDTTCTEPFQVARQFATLDHLSDGRAAWNLVTSSDPLTGKNFRRGAYLNDGDRGRRAEEFLAVARQFWDSWAADAVIADRDTGVYVDPDRIRTVQHRGKQFDVRGVATLPRAPQGHPVLLQAADSPDGATFVAGHGREPNRRRVFSAAQVVGTPVEVADEIDRRVQAGECDGVILGPGGLDDFVDRVVPLLQQRGSFRTAYAGPTLRDHLGL